MFSDQMVKNISRVVDDVRRLFLVERFVDSIKVSAWAYLWGFFGIQTPKRILFFYKILIKTLKINAPQIPKHPLNLFCETDEFCMSRRDRWNKSVRQIRPFSDVWCWLQQSK